MSKDTGIILSKEAQAQRLAERGVADHDTTMERLAQILLKQEQVENIAETENLAIQLEEQTIRRLVLELMAFEKLSNAKELGFRQTNIRLGTFLKRKHYKVSYLETDLVVAYIEERHGSGRIAWSEDGEIFIRPIILIESISKARYGQWQSLNDVLVNGGEIETEKLIKSLRYMIARCENFIDIKAVKARHRVSKAQR